MLRRFPLLALVLSGLAGAGAAVLLFTIELPVSWSEWIDTGSGRVVFVRHVMGIEVSSNPAASLLADIYIVHVGPAAEPHWVQLRTYQSMPAYLAGLGLKSSGSGSDEGSEYLCGGISLCLTMDESWFTAEERRERKELLNLRYTPECRREIMRRTLELVRISGGVKSAVDYACDAFAMEQSVRGPLTVDQLPEVEEYYQRWRDGSRR